MNGLGFRARDIEEGGAQYRGGTGGSGKLQFYSFKWGVKPYVEVSSRRRLKAAAVLVFWACIVLPALGPVLGY